MINDNNNIPEFQITHESMQVFIKNHSAFTASVNNWIKLNSNNLHNLNHFQNLIMIFLQEAIKEYQQRTEEKTWKRFIN
jgi:hypothetical protein